jgi:hypothetical protein
VVAAGAAHAPAPGRVVIMLVVSCVFVFVMFVVFVSHWELLCC